MITYLTAEQVLFIHARLIAEIGGEYGLRDLGLLQSDIAHPQASFEDELYPDLFAKAAALMESLVNNHPFLDGNKRAGITAVALFLQLNGYKLVVDNPTLESFTLQVAQSDLNVEQIAIWFREHTRQL